MIEKNPQATFVTSGQGFRSARSEAHMHFFIMHCWQATNDQNELAPAFEELTISGEDRQVVMIRCNIDILSIH